MQRQSAMPCCIIRDRDMIAFLRGTVEDMTESSLVLDVHGVGYEVLVPGQLLSSISGTGQELKLYTYMQVREDAVVLFGFLTKDDLAMFKMQIGVNGVGPKADLRFCQHWEQTIFVLRYYQMMRRKSPKHRVSEPRLRRRSFWS